MCGIIDASVVGSIFSKSGKISECAEKFLVHVQRGKLTLFIGGKLQYETDTNERARNWFREARRRGLVRQKDSRAIASTAANLAASNQCKSNDHHVLALARVSGARLLYTNDQKLIKDFTNREIIDMPRGRVYTDRQSGKFTKGHEKLLRENVCSTQ
ncbi:MAG: PIN domain-containing protein [Rhodobacteraceae bacterium]|nr:PIN domain-containing protein [Paracoccaceae bacterium]